MIIRTMLGLLMKISLGCLLVSFTLVSFTGCQEASASKAENTPSVSTIKVKTDKGCLTVYDAPFAIKPPAASANDDVDRPNHCKVFDIVDGDTFTCDFNNDGVIVRKTEKVRMLYIDTPEIHHSKRNPSGEPQPFSKEAKAYTTNQLLGKIVYLRYDTKPEDRYGRKLALVYTVDPAKTKSISVNEQLLLEGLATVMIIKPNATYQAQIKALEDQALAAKKGVWSAPLDF
ncbi:MAG: thermonuclease family protein [Vampirovibrio sp.]|jgi:endonuclease YncB( thermonuclease family)|nr:thermonuclease family protein [Vampirovibrio sp.]